MDLCLFYPNYVTMDIVTDYGYRDFWKSILHQSYKTTFILKTQTQSTNTQTKWKATTDGNFYGTM